MLSSKCDPKAKQRGKMPLLFLVLPTVFGLFFVFFRVAHLLNEVRYTSELKPMYRRILVAVDGSYASHLALQEALKLAKETKGQLHLVHAIDLTPGVEGGLDPETFRRTARQDGNDLLRQMASRAGEAGVDAEGVMLEASRRKFSKAIAKEARHWEADLIIMGTHGRNGIARLVVGSVAEGVLHIAPVPVLLIR
jgi:nucleotide-binding universal stress UspA family protein